MRERRLWAFPNDDLGDPKDVVAVEVLGAGEGMRMRCGSRDRDRGRKTGFCCGDLWAWLERGHDATYSELVGTGATSARQNIEREVTMLRHSTRCVGWEGRGDRVIRRGKRLWCASGTCLFLFVHFIATFCGLSRSLSFFLSGGSTESFASPAFSSPLSGFLTRRMALPESLRSASEAWAAQLELLNTSVTSYEEASSKLCQLLDPATTSLSEQHLETACEATFGLS